MGLFERFPYTNFHDLNLDWILNEIRTMEKTFNDFVSINALKYADPIQWNIVQQYEKNTIVIDPLTGTAYISVQPVPSGIALTNPDYWTVVFDLGSFVVRAAKNFTTRYEEETTLTATFPSSVNDWLIWGDTLYYALVNITAGDQYVIDSNIKRFTVEEVVGHIQDLNTTDKSNLVAAINEVLQTIFDVSGDLDSLNTTDKSNLVAAINEVLQTIFDVSGDLASLTTTDKSNLVAAINEVFNNRAWISSKDFGLVGDGVTDDAPAFVQMISYAASHNKSIKLESGKVFGLSYGFSIPSYTYIDGSNSTIKWLSETSVGLQCHGEHASPDGTNPSPDSEQATGYNGHHDIVIKNIIFNSNSPTVARSCSVVTFHSKNVIIENCTFLNDTYNHAMEINASKNIIIDHCKFADNIAGNDITRTEINLDIATSGGIPGYGTLSAAYDNTICSDIFITDCIFESVMSCFDSHGTLSVGGNVLTPVDGILIDNILVIDSEIITTMQSWTNFNINNVIAKNMLFNYDNVAFRLHNAHHGKINNINMIGFTNGLGTTANVFAFRQAVIDGITSKTYSVDVSNVDIACDNTDIVRVAVFNGATGISIDNVTIRNTDANYLFSCQDNASYNCYITRVWSTKCNGLYFDSLGSSFIFDDIYLDDNTSIGVNNGYLRIFNSRFKNVTVTDNSNNYRHSNIGYCNRTDNNVITDMGYNAGAAVTDGSYVDVTITFTKTFYATPRLFLTQYGGNRPKLEYAIQTVSTTGATVRIRNNSGGDYTDCPFLWLAIRDSIDT